MWTHFLSQDFQTVELVFNYNTHNSARLRKRHESRGKQEVDTYGT